MTAALDFFRVQDAGHFSRGGMRRCLDCSTIIRLGSRCRRCRAAYRVPPHWSELVKRRDGYRCVICGSTTQVEADHIIPRSRGGQHTLENGRTLCHQHHREAHGGQAAKAG
jgi:5-methylcytosine-specific restriction endonuclease McrA